MNVQTQQLENHKAQLTVELDIAQIDQAKQVAARKISKRVNIPGFRKGKAPYRILVNFVGEGAILEEAIETLGSDIYKLALEQSGVEPYGPGAIEDFQLEPNPTFIFTVPLQPTVSLNDYRSVRLDFDEPEVTDEMVDNAMKMLQSQQALVEESHQPVAETSQVTVDVHALLIDEDGASEAETAEESGAAEDESEEHDEHEHDHEHDHHHDHGHDSDNVFMHNHDLVLRLEADDVTVLPGFKEALLGADVGAALSFELTVPDDEEVYDEDIRGRRVSFDVTVKKVENVTLPEMNDEFAAKASENEEEPLTLLQLRMRMRETLEKELKERTHTEYSRKVLDQIVEQADIAYPDEMIADEAEELIKDLDSRLRQQGLNLDAYMTVTGRTKEQILEEYREPAQNMIRRQLTMLELLKEENIQVNENHVDARIEEMLAAFGAQADAMRSLFDSPQVRMNIINDLLNERLFDVVAAIGQGKELVQEEVVSEDETPADETTAEETSEADAEAETGEQTE